MYKALTLFLMQGMVVRPKKLENKGALTFLNII